MHLSNTQEGRINCRQNRFCQGCFVGKTCGLPPTRQIMYNLTYFHVCEYQSRKHRSIPKSDFVISAIAKINVIYPPTETNEEECTCINQVQVIGIPQIDVYRTCLLCRTCVEPCTPPCGKCTRPDCQMIQLFDLCPHQISTRVLLCYTNEEWKF